MLDSLPHRHRLAGHGLCKQCNTAGMKINSEGVENYYEILGVDREADPETIRQAYLGKIKQWHPDRNAHRLAEAEAMTKILNAAYATLKDPAQRKAYDRMIRFTRGKDFRQTVNEQAFEQKFARAAPLFKRFSDNVRELFTLFTHAVRGEYHLHPVTLGTIGGGLLYFIVPTDLIPDFLPFVGFLDDLAVLTMIVNSLQTELLAFRRWRSKTS